MPNRITEANLLSVIRTLNEMTGNPLESYTKHTDGRMTSNPGNFHLDGAYGGWKLVQMCKGGGTRDVLYQGYMTKRELYERIIAYKYGIMEGAAI